MVAMLARSVRASTTVRPVLARNAGAAEAANFAGGLQSACAPPKSSSKRRAFLRSSCVGRPLEGSGGAGWSGAGRIGGSLELTSLPDLVGRFAIVQENR